MWDTPQGGNIKKKLAEKRIRPEKISIVRRGDHIIEVPIRRGQALHFQVIIKRSDIGVGLKFTRKSREAVPTPETQAQRVESTAEATNSGDRLSPKVMKKDSSSSRRVSLPPNGPTKTPSSPPAKSTLSISSTTPASRPRRREAYVIPVKKFDSDGSPHLFSAVAPRTGVFSIVLDNLDSPMLGTMMDSLFSHFFVR